MSGLYLYGPPDSSLEIGVGTDSWGNVPFDVCVLVRSARSFILGEDRKADLPKELNR